MEPTEKDVLIAKKLFNPFPGLRPFNPDEAHLFFGREGQSEEVLEKLSLNKFVAVLGASGTGKSSLIYCGLLPVLFGGFLHNGRSKWKIIVARPGSNPIFNLAQSFTETFQLNQSSEKIESDKYINHAILNRSVNGIEELIEQYEIHENENILLLIDQFEELFRYQYSSQNQEALNKSEHYVNLLVNAVKKSNLPIYTVITMRSDFIGDCSPYQNLTGLINDSNYLIPRMTREDFRKAVTGPVAVGGAKISEQLVQLLLNEMGNNPDQLPILQHALMRTWDYWLQYGDAKKVINVADYEAVGRLERALSNHANEAYDELNVEEKQVCEKVFKSLTEKGADNRGVRRPTSISDLAEISESDVATVSSIVEKFRKKGRTFVTPSPEIELEPDSLVDISHESLMRVWDKLKIWVEEEASAVKMYIRLSESAEFYQEGRTGLWRPPDLQLAINWRNKQKPNLAWAKRYNPAFERTLVYLKTSEEEYNAEEENKIKLQKRAIRRSRIVALVLGTAAIISIGIGILAYIQRQEALVAQIEAVKQQKEAERQKAEAERQSKLASEKEQEALQEKANAELQSKIAEDQRRRALINLEEAEKQKKIAQEKSDEAEEQRVKAEENANRALEQQKLAEQASKDAETRRVISTAQSMAVKSQLMKQDTLLKGLLAYQAFLFNEEYKGLEYDPDIFTALYASKILFEGADYNHLSAHENIVRTLAFDGDILYSSGSDGKLFSWNTQTKTSELLAEELTIVRKIDVQDGVLAAITARRLIVFKSDGRDRKDYPFDFILKDMFLIDSDRYLIVGENKILTYSVSGNSTVLFENNSKIVSATVDKKKELVVVCMENGEVWKIEGVENEASKIYIWYISTGNSNIELRGHNAKMASLAFNASAKLMVSTSYDGTAKLWRVDDLNTLPVTFDDHSSWVMCAAFDKNDFLFTGEKNGIIRKYPTETKVLVIDFCSYLSRDLSQEEWNTYVGEDIAYKELKCND